MNLGRAQTQKILSNFARIFMRLGLPFIVFGMVEWLVCTQIGNMPLWKARQSDTSAVQT